MTLRNIKASILEWKKRITPPNYKNFNEFNEYQKSIAQFRKCTKCSKDSKLFFSCANCCLEFDSVYCIDCFAKSDHTNHRISVSMATNAVCDCGDPRLIKASSFCDKHKVGTGLDEELPDPSYIKNLGPVIREVFNYIIRDISNEEFVSNSLDFLLEILDWGTIYSNFISSIFLKGTWEESYFGCIFRSNMMLGDLNTEKFSRFLLKNSSSKIFERGFTIFMYDVIEKCLSVYKNSHGSILEKIELTDVAYQCFHNVHLNIELENDHKLFTRILHLLNHVFTHDTFLQSDKYTLPLLFNQNLHQNITNIYVLLFKNPFFMQFIVKNTEFMNELGDFLSINSENSLIMRETGDKVPYNTPIGFFQFYNFRQIRQIIQYFATSFSYLTLDLTEDLASDEISKLPIPFLNQSHIDILNQFYGLFIGKFRKLLDSVPCRDNNFGGSSYIIQPYSDYFAFQHPLATFIIQTATCFSLYNSLETVDIFARIGFTQFDQFAAIITSCIAAKFQCRYNLFAKNDDSQNLAGRIYHINNLISGLQSIISMKATIESPGSIVMTIAESFGLSIWASVDDPYDFANWTNVITMMLWLFIIMVCYDNFFYFNMDLDKMCKLVTDLVYSNQRTTRAQLVQKLYGFTPKKVLADEAIQKALDIRTDDKGSHFTLKTNEFTTIFSPYTGNDFFQLLAHEIDSQKGQLFNLLPIQTDSIPAFRLLKTYLHTNEMIYIIIQVCDIILDKESVSLVHTLFSLIRLILIDSNDPKKTENDFLSNEIIQKVIVIMKKVDNADLYLQNFAKECQSRYPEIAELVSKSVEIKEKKKPKIDRAAILLQFQNSLNLFAQENKSELDSIQNFSGEESTCVFCDEGFDLENGCYGILINVFKSSLLSKVEMAIAHDFYSRYPPTAQIRACGHWTHDHCFKQNNALEYPQLSYEYLVHCPLDRSTSNVYVPVFHGDQPNDATQRKIMALQTIISSICDLSCQQCLAYNLALTEILCRHNPTYIDDKRSILGLIHFLRACFFIIPDVEIIETYDPFVWLTYNFCQKGQFKQARERFDSLLPTYWHKVLCLELLYTSTDERMLRIETYVRRAALLEHLALHSDSDSFFFPSVEEFITTHTLTPIDDELKTCVMDHYGIPSLSPCYPYSFPKLKENFIDYFLEPEISENCKYSNCDFCQCIICGQYCFIPLHRDDGSIVLSGSIEPLLDHLISCCGTFAPFLFLSGEFASSIEIFDTETSIEHSHFGSIYTDVYGDTNIGLQYDSILHLNHGRVEKFIESLFSGDFKRLFVRE